MLGFGKYRYSLLVTVSAAALMVTVEQGPLAADIAPVAQDKWWFAVEGQYLLYDGDPVFEGKDPSDGFDLTPDDGWGVGGEIGFRPADSLWSFLGRVRYGQSNKVKEDSSFFYSYDGFYSASNAEGSHREKHLIADLEIGRDVGLGSLGDGSSNIRLFAGLRFAHFKSKGSFSSSFYTSIFVSGGSDLDIKRKFTGIGPRIGFDAMMPLSEQFSLDIGAAGALLFGKQKFNASGFTSSFGNPFDVDEKRSRSVVVPNLEASAALSWLVTENAKFSLGYRVDSYFDVYDSGPVFGSDGEQADRIIHGPFIKLTIGTSDDGG